MNSFKSPSHQQALSRTGSETESLRLLQIQSRREQGGNSAHCDALLCHLDCQEAVQLSRVLDLEEAAAGVAVENGFHIDGLELHPAVLERLLIELHLLEHLARDKAFLGDCTEGRLRNCHCRTQCYRPVLHRLGQAGYLSAVFPSLTFVMMLHQPKNL